MNLVNVQAWSRYKGQERSVASVVQDECLSDYDDTLSRLANTGDKTAKMLGAVVEMLHENGAVTDQNIESLLSSGWEVKR